MNAVDLAARAGITYRQLDVWTNSGYLRPLPRKVSVRGGVPRQYPLEEQRIAMWMARLVDAGMTPAAACRIARGEGDAREKAAQALLSGWKESA